MKTFCFIFITWLGQYYFQAYALTGNKSLNEFFILGTLKDYMGRTLDPREESLLDRYDIISFSVLTCKLQKNIHNTNYWL